jgi:hypothetical protein
MYIFVAMIVEKVTKELNLYFLFSTLLGMLNVYKLNHSKQQVMVLNKMERQKLIIVKNAQIHIFFRITVKRTIFDST